MNTENEKMTAIEFIKIRHRMCCTEGDCHTCPLEYFNNPDGIGCEDYIYSHLDEAIGVFKQWAKEHPAKTKQSEFLKHYPNAFLNDGSLIICPRFVEKDFVCPEHAGCISCRRRYWTQESE